MDFSISWVLLWTICAELFLLYASASEDNTHNEEDDYPQLPMYFVDEQSDIVIPLRSPTAIGCTVVSSSDAQINITWLKDGHVIADTITRWVLPDGTLRLEAVEPHRDEGSYECLAKHPFGAIASRRIRLEAPTAPEFVQHPQDLVAFQGESVRLECIANGTPPVVISWVKNGRPLDINQARVNAFSGVLQIVDAMQQDDGTYECLATNTAGQQKSLAANVTIHSSNENERLSLRLLAGPLNQTVAVFDNVVLECFLSGRPRPTVSWMKQGGATFSSMGRVRVTRHGNLEINSVQLSDGGTYVCSWQSTDPSETKASRQARLSVLAPPQLVHDGIMDLRTEGLRRQDVRLKCEFEGVPVPRVVWLKNGRLLEPIGRIRIDEWELTITSSDTSDSGFYQCRGENSVGAFQSTTWVEIKANENAPLPPIDLVVIPLSSTSVRMYWSDNPLNENRSVMAYSIHAVPMRGGFEIQKVQKQEDGTDLNWEVFQPFTNYTFFVIAYNNGGWSAHSAHVTALTFEDVPLESPLMEITPVGSTGLRLHWSELGPNLARGVIRQYKILHRHHGNSSFQENLVNADVREFVIEGLQSGVEYDVIVLAGTTKGFPKLDSVPWVTVTTEAAKNAGVPTRAEVNVSLVSSNSITVSWMADNAFQIVGFRLTCRRIGQKHHVMKADDVIRIISLDNDASKYIFAELEYYAVYQVTLASQNQFGWSNSITKTFRTEAAINGDAKGLQVNHNGNALPEIDLPNPPTSIFAKSINSSAITVNWERPTGVNDITRYTIRYHPESKETVSDISVVKFVTSPVEMVMIGDLSAHTLYDLSVQTHANNAIGRFSSVVKCRTEEGIPSKPVNIELTVYSDTAVQVTWEPPAQCNGVITRYNIFYTTDHRNTLSDWLTKTISGSSLSTLVSYLKPNTIYYFRLRAATFAEHGPLSDIVQIRTQNPSDLYYRDATDLAASNALTDQDFGIIIGSAIGITCIVLCVIFIVVRDRHSARHAAPASHVANGAVKSCRCHLANGPDTEAEPWRRAASDDDDDFPSVNSVLVENENCDTKGGYTRSERQGRIPVRAVAGSRMCNGIQHCDRQQDQLVDVPLSTGNEKSASMMVTDNKGGMLPSKQSSSSMPSDQIESHPLAHSDIVSVEPVDPSNKGTYDGSKESNESDEDLPISHINQEDETNESESLMGDSRRASHCIEMLNDIAVRSTSCIEVDRSRNTTEEEEEKMVE